MTTAAPSGRAASRDIPEGMLRLAFVLLVVVVAMAPYTGADLVTIGVAAIVVVVGLLQPPRRRLPVALTASLTIGGGLCSVSVAWSVAPFSTFPFGVAVLATLTALLVVARRFDVWSVLDGLASGLRIVLLVTLAVAVVAPGVGLVDEDYQTGALKGLFEHRNLLAFVALIALILYIFLGSIRSRGWVFAHVALASACLLGSQSQTALVSLGAALAMTLALVVISRMRGLPRVLVGIFVTVGVGYVVYLCLFFLGDVAADLGRDATLTGRTDVWPAVLQAIARHPVLGYGWDGLWHENDPTTNEMWRAAGFKMYHAHDGFLEILLELGVVGLFVVGIMLLAGLVVSVLKRLAGGGPEYLWAFATTIALVISDISEAPSTTFFGCLVLGCVLVVAMSSDVPRAVPPLGSSTLTHPVGTRS